MRIKYIKVRVSDEELIEFRRKAKKAVRTFSDWVRVVLHKAK